MILSLTLFTITLCIIYYYITRTFNYWRSKNVKGPKPIPFFGNFKEVALRRQHMGMFYYDMYNKYPEEKVVGLYRMTAPSLLIRDLDIVKQILIKDFEAFPDRGTYFSKEGFGDNIFHANIDMWKYLKQQFSSAFTTTKIKGVFDSFLDCGDKFVDYIENVTIKNSEQDVYNMMLKYTVGTTMSATFGLKVDTFNEDSRLFEIVDEQLTNSHYQEIDLTFPGILMKLNLSILTDEMIKFCHQIIKAGILQSITKKDIRNVMDVILKLNKESDSVAEKQKKLGDMRLPTNSTLDLQAAQVWVFYSAGYANNTLSLTYAMYHLARNPDVQEKLREEIITVMDEHNGMLTYESLKAMKYLDMVFNETLRINPLTNGLVRSVSRDIELDGVNVTLNKGTIVTVSPYAIHHDERYYPDPDKFDPERFLPENIKNRHSYAFLPFGAGQRSCLGSQMARIQFGVCLAKVLYKFRVETTKNTVSSITYNPRRLLLSPDKKIWLNFLPA